MTLDHNLLVVGRKVLGVGNRQLSFINTFVRENIISRNIRLDVSDVNVGKNYFQRKVCKLKGNVTYTAHGKS